MIDLLDSFVGNNDIVVEKLDKLTEENELAAGECGKNINISHLNRIKDQENLDKRLNQSLISGDEADETESDDDDEDEKEAEKGNEKDENAKSALRRSKTLPATGLRLRKGVLLKDNSILMQSCNNIGSTVVNLKLNITNDRFKMAKDEAEKAIKERKIFTIVGPYQSLRNALRRRGWVEKFDSTSLKSSKHGGSSNKKKNNNQSSDDVSSSDDDADEEEVDEIKPWEENNGYYGILSRLVKSFNPNFIWTVKATTLDYPYLSKDQIVNHFNRNGTFTTKIGLCSNIRNSSWYCSENCDEFFPRCYKLCQEDDRKAFIDDYRLTSCISLLKYFLIKYRNESDEDYLDDVHITSAEELMKIQRKTKTDEGGSAVADDPQSVEAKLNQQHQQQTPPQTPLSKINPLSDEQQSATKQSSITHKRSSSVSKSKNSLTSIPLEAIEFAIEQIDRFVDFKENNDLDLVDFNVVGEDKWQKFSEWFYAACHDKKPFKQASESLYDQAVKCLEVAKTYWPQYNIDGFRNIWIVKPGALSRGRGIIVFDKLENILELNRSPLQRDGKYVVQKYIERPLLIHKIKFDIRQWFLVTDFNPLTIWMYKDSYLRFCTHTFTLDSTQQSVHLCNYSIQKNYKNESGRDESLPAENMWSSADFIDKYLRKQGRAHLWSECVYAGMRRAIVSSMLSVQDVVEPRKHSFELYGADFMLTDDMNDLRPWLIEINCSPTMAKSTEVTKWLCDVVLEDVCRVVLDRRANRNADTGRFELIYRASAVTVPNYVGIDLKQFSPQQSISTSSSFNSSSSSSQKRQSSLSISKPNINPNTNENEIIIDLRPSQNAIKRSSMSPTSKSITQINSHQTKISKQQPIAVETLNKETFPALDGNNSTKQQKALRNPMVSFYQSIERRATNYVLKLASEINLSTSASLNPHLEDRHSIVNDVRFRKRQNVQTRSILNEPKLFEFKHYESNLSVNRRPLLLKRSSLPYHHLVKISRNRHGSVLEKTDSPNTLTIKLNKRKKHKNMQLSLSRLEVSDLGGI